MTKSKNSQAKIMVRAKRGHVHPTIKYRAVHAEGWMAMIMIMTILAIRLVKLVVRISWPVIVSASKITYRLANELVLWFYARTH